MGLIVGLLAGAGVLLIYLALTSPPTPTTRRRQSRLARALIDADMAMISPPVFIVASVVIAFLVGVTTVALTTGMTVSVVAALAAGLAPTWYVVHRAAKARSAIAGVWPDVIDNLLSSIRSGMPLAEALSHLAATGPPAARNGFCTFRHALAATGKIDHAFDAVKERFADPVCDRLIEALRVANDVGGHDVGTLLRALAANLRAEQRARGELLARQSWTVNGARLAAAAPWLLLAMLSTRPENARAFDSASGMMLLFAGAIATVIAHRAMRYLGALPTEGRTLA